ncbi:MAG: TonB-dependent receptor [Flavobacteriales bacterium]|nr:TonB-dependent receptor [Flavobacteriales bacterium]
MQNLWLLAMLIVVPFSSLKAQENCNFSISGKVFDEHDGSVLAFANLWIPQLKKGAVADIDGKYSLKALCPGKYTIVVSHLGCESDSFKLILRPKGNRWSVVQNYQLEHHTEELREVEISGKQVRLVTTEKLDLSEEQLRENEGKPLGEILKSLNGVNAIKTGANISKPMINGFSANRVQIINQGVQFQSQQWGNEHAPEIDPFAASNYSVIKGAGAVKYASGALGGLVIIEAKDLPSNAGLHGELNALYASNNRLGNGSLLLEGNTKLIPKFSWRVQGSVKRSGNVKTPNYYQKNTGVKELNGSADLGYKSKQWNVRLFYSQFNSEIGIFSGAHIGNLTDLKNAIKRSEPREEDQEGFSYEIRRPYQRIIHEVVKLELNWFTENWGALNIKLNRQFNIREEFDKEKSRNDDLAALNIPEFSLGLESVAADLNWRVPQYKRLKTELGIQIVSQNNSVNSLTDFIPDFSNQRYSFYAVEQWKKRKLALELGLRLEQNEFSVSKLINREFQSFEHSYLSATGKLGGIYTLSNYQELKLNLTYSERPPAINELYSDGLHHGSASLEFGDEALGKEKSYAINSSYKVEKGKWNYQIYAYLQYVEDFIYLQPTGFQLTIRGAFPAYQWENTNVLIRGLDQTFSYQLRKKLKYENRLSLLWGNNLSKNNYLINMPANQIENDLEYRFQNRKDSSFYKFSLGHRYVLKQNRFNTEEEFAIPPKAYSLFKVGFSYRTFLNQNSSLLVGLTVTNLLNERYRAYLNRFRYYADEQGRNITIRIKYNF